MSNSAANLHVETGDVAVVKLILSYVWLSAVLALALNLENCVHD